MAKQRLIFKIGRVTLKNPVIAASGTFGYGKQMQEIFDIDILGGFVTKTITLKPRKGNKPPRIYDLGFGVINSIGLENPGLERFKRDYLESLNRLKTKVFISIYGEEFREWKELILSLNKENIAGFELNFSCPNIKKSPLYLNSKWLYSFINRLRPYTKKLLIAKLPFLSNIKDIAVSLKKANIDAITLINTIPAMAVGVGGKPVLGNLIGGLSGPCIKPVALGCIYEVKKVVSLPIIGCGGIMNYRDVLDFLNLGANAVQVGTANLIDPFVCKKIIEDLKRYYEKKN